MSHIFGSYEPFGSLKSTFFHGFIAQYFLTFIIEHPVYSFQAFYWLTLELIYNQNSGGDMRQKTGVDRR